MIFLMLFSSFAVYAVKDMAVVPTILDDSIESMQAGHIPGFNDAEMIKDIYSGSSGSNPSELASADGILYFRANDGVNGDELWASDGTSGGTVLVKDFNSGAGTNVNSLVEFDGMLYFTADVSGSGMELWKSDGSSSGTMMVKDIYSGSSGSWPASLTVVGNTLYFQATDGTNGRELWKSDGTSSGTMLVKDIYSSGSSEPIELTAVGNTLYFSAKDSVGRELWKSDGTENGTVLVKNIWTGSPGPGDSNPSLITSIGSTLYFQATSYNTANAASNGYELWKSDGTSNGTVMVKDIRLGQMSSSPYGLIVMGSTLYFQANDGINGYELWESDGTANGTVMVKDIYNGSSGSSPNQLTVMGSTFYFRANGYSASAGGSGYELWKSDGTTSGTMMVKDIYSGSSSSSPSNFSVINNKFYFSANDGTNGVELWKSDGTSSGTVMVKDINSGSGGASSNPDYLTAVGSSLFFSANDGSNGVELWKATTTSTPSVEISGEILWRDTIEDLEAYWTASNLSIDNTYNVVWKLLYDSNNTVIWTHINNSFTPSASAYTGTTQSWSLGNTEITRGLTYCVEATIFLSSTALDNDVSCTTIPSGGGGW
jgi:ELWxxDGT repeat protein